MLPGASPEGIPAACLARLLPHLRPSATALTGGLAIHLHLVGAGLPSTRRWIPDLDLVAADAEAVSPSVATVFLVNHYHLPQPGYARFLVQLVDPVTRMRVDVFPDVGNRLATATLRRLGGLSFSMVAAAGILAHKLQTIAAACIDSPVDEKHVEDAAALARLLGQCPPTVPPAHVGRDRYQTDPTVPCPRCDASRRQDFPLAAKDRVLGLLGHV